MLEKFLQIKREEYDRAKQNNHLVLMQVIRQSVKKTLKLKNVQLQPRQLELF